jgi:hypothetical protein
MPIAIESSSPGQYLGPMESQLVMLGSVIFLLNDEQRLSIINYVSSLAYELKNSFVDGVDRLPNLIDRPAQETRVKD